MKAVDRSIFSKDVVGDDERGSELLEDAWSHLRSGDGSRNDREGLVFEVLYAFGAAGKNIRQSAVGSLAVFLTIAITIFLSGAFLLTVQPVVSFILEDAQQIPLRITLTDGVKRGSVAELQAELSTFEEISEVQFVRGEEALQHLQRRLGRDHPLFQERFAGIGSEGSKSLSGEEQDPSQLLPDRLLVFASSESDKEVLREELRDLLGGDPRVAGITLQSQVAEQLFHLARLFSRIGVFSLISLVIGAVLLVLIASQLRYLLRAEEVHAMRLVGASRRFIELPLYLESVILALAAVGVSLFAYGQIEQLFAESLNVAFPFLAAHEELFSLSLSWKIAFLSLGIGAALFGTFCALRFFFGER
ncbi:permease-like cell division protein FtsX [bacterium]|nr:permease-like cell division protein FtsX [bacterium]